MIGFLKRGINLIFFNEGDNNVFSPLRSENELFINFLQ
jgi:hypothetical protein